MFKKWLKTFIHEKNLDGFVLTVEGESCNNYIPIEFLIDAMAYSSVSDQQAIKNSLVKLDFANANIVHFLTHCAKAIAV